MFANGKDSNNNKRDDENDCGSGLVEEEEWNSDIRMRIYLKDTLKVFEDFTNKQKSVWSNVFWYVGARPLRGRQTHTPLLLYVFVSWSLNDGIKKSRRSYSY